MRLLFAILLGKFISFVSKFLKIGGGSAAPGLYALSIDPNLVQKLAAKIPKNIVITGTNGKTTTAKMLAHFAQKAGLKVIRNHTGSNLERGIASTLISHYTLNPKPYTLNLGIWELDEAAFNIVVPKLQPDIVIFLNIFRDQLDRYGEIDTIVKRWEKTLKNIPSTAQIFINGDDANILKLSKSFLGKIQKFGVKDYKIIGESIERKKAQKTVDFEAKNIKLNGLNGSSFLLHTPYSILHTTLPLPGAYHIYDFLASFAAGLALGLEPKQMTTSLKDYSPAFGRMEKVPFGYIFLIKNPTGATAVFETIAPVIKSQDRLILALNDNIADGTDVSWIWDADFKKLLQLPLQETLRLHSGRPSNHIFAAGTRAYDLAVRLKYAGIDPKQISIQPDLNQALQEARKALKGRLFILPTYTAMLQLQSILAKSGLKKHYWEVE